MEKMDLLKNISVVLDKANKPDIQQSSVVKTMALNMFNEWAKLAKPLIKQADSVKHTKKAINAFIKKIDKEMAKFPAKVKKDNAKFIDFLYRYSKDQFIKSENIKQASKAVSLPTIEPGIWATTDTASIEALETLTSKTVDGFYQGSVQTAVANSIKKNVFERNLTGDAATKAMKNDLAKALKLKSGALESKVVPKGFRGTADNYFKGLSQHTSTLARTSSNLNTLDYVGAEYVQIHSVRSARTCLGCLEMDGKKYKTKEAVAHMNKILTVDSIESLKKIQPSFHFKNSGEYEGNEDKLKEQKLKAKEMVSQQMYLPPFHFLCECFITRG